MSTLNHHNSLPKYPFLPQNRSFSFVQLNDPMMIEARKVTNERSACSWWPTGAVVVKNNKIIGRGANAGNYTPVCPRIAQSCPTGTGYELCHDICQTEGHAEVSAINNAMSKGYSVMGADLYLFGHWWCCQPCWEHMITHGIRAIYLAKNAHNLFTRSNRLELSERVKELMAEGHKVNSAYTVWDIENPNL